MHPNLWYPYTQAKTAPESLKVKAAQDVWLERETGFLWKVSPDRGLDCLSSWWVGLHGHAHPKDEELAFVYRGIRTILDKI